MVILELVDGRETSSYTPVFSATREAGEREFTFEASLGNRPSLLAVVGIKTMTKSNLGSQGSFDLHNLITVLH